jgi:light-regulated signal transduction histidine kinase (bacteriophytochrome)
MAKKITQRDRVLQYIMEHGHITSYKAYKDIGCTQLATRISELKDRGFSFRKERVKTVNMYGDPTHYDMYILIKTGEA